MDGEAILIQIQQQLSRIENNAGRTEGIVTSIQEDIHELRNQDVLADQKLQEAYDRAMQYASNRQDNIKAELQQQISSNKTQITEIQNAVLSLTQNINEMVTGFRKSMEADFIKLQNRVTQLENKKAQKLVKWYDNITEKLIWLALGMIGTAIIYYIINAVLGGKK